jgi:hypothetical protein
MPAARDGTGCTSIFKISAPVFLVNSSRYSWSGTISICVLVRLSLFCATKIVAWLPCTTRGAPTPLPTEQASCIVHSG